MPRWTATLLAALALASTASATKPPVRPLPADPEPLLAEGRVVASANETVVNGWKRHWSTDYVRRTWHDRTVHEVPECCVTVFGKGNAWLVLKTDVVNRDRQGAPVSERVVKRLWVTNRPNEMTADCQILWINTALSLVDTKTDAIRSVVVDGDDLKLIEWRGSSSACAFGD